MIVYSDTTPFIALALVDLLDLLPALFERIHVVPAVFDECAYGGPVRVPSLRSLPWVVSCDIPANPVSTTLLQLGAGERETISLALASHADLVIMDERLGRRLAEYLGLRVTGTLGVLAKAKAEGLIQSFREPADAMRRRGIYFHAGLIDRLAKSLGE